MLAPTAELDYHVRQYDEPYRSTVALAAFIREIAGNITEGVVIDFGCGAGANLHWLAEMGVTGAASLVGIEQDPELVDIARRRCPGATFLQGDMLHKVWGANIGLSIQTLSFVEDWRPLLAHMVRNTARWLFVSSLFWDGIETHTHVGEKHYNVIEAESFVHWAKRWGAQEVTWREFAIDRELTNDHRKLGTYTRAGLQFSGPLFLPWRFAAVRMGPK